MAQASWQNSIFGLFVTLGALYCAVPFGRTVVELFSLKDGAKVVAAVAAPWRIAWVPVFDEEKLDAAAFAVYAGLGWETRLGDEFEHFDARLQFEARRSQSLDEKSESGKVG